MRCRKPANLVVFRTLAKKHSTEADAAKKKNLQELLQNMWLMGCHKKMVEGINLLTFRLYSPQGIIRENRPLHTKCAAAGLKIHFV